MITQEFVKAVILKATGKPSELSTSDVKYKKIIGIGNYYIDAWQNEPGVDWQSLYDPAFKIGDIGLSDMYEIDLLVIRKISDTPGDFILIKTLNENRAYKTVTGNQLKRYKSGNYCAQIGNKLYFNRKFTSDDAEYGGDILVPIYTHAKKLTDATSEIPVDNPLWLVTISAAEFVRNDTTKQNQYPNLINEANQLMQRMIDDNGAQISEIYSPWGIPGVS